MTDHWRWDLSRYSVPSSPLAGSCQYLFLVRSREIGLVAALQFHISITNRPTIWAQLTYACFRLVASPLPIIINVKSDNYHGISAHVLYFLLPIYQWSFINGYHASHLVSSLLFHISSILADGMNCRREHNNGHLVQSIGKTRREENSLNSPLTILAGNQLVKWLWQRTISVSDISSSTDNRLRTIRFQILIHQPKLSRIHHSSTNRLASCAIKTFYTYATCAWGFSPQPYAHLFLDMISRYPIYQWYYGATNGYPERIWSSSSLVKYITLSKQRFSILSLGPLMAKISLTLLFVVFSAPSSWGQSSLTLTATSSNLTSAVANSNISAT